MIPAAGGCVHFPEFSGVDHHRRKRSQVILHDTSADSRDSCYRDEIILHDDRGVPFPLVVIGDGLNGDGGGLAVERRCTKPCEKKKTVAHISVHGHRGLRMLKNYERVS